MSKIEWTGKTWNPIVGCSVVSPGCTNCYAMRMAARLERMSATQFPQYAGTTRPSKAGPVWTGKVALAEGMLDRPLRVRTPTTWFVNSMGDLFHEDVPDEWILRVLDVIRQASYHGGSNVGRIDRGDGEHTFQCLTKRSRRMRDVMTRLRWDGEMLHLLTHDDGRSRVLLRNLWLGVSAERQHEADARVPDLIETPAAVRFVSAEPLLGPVDFTRRMAHPAGDRLSSRTWLDAMDWIIVGGESGAGARPMHPGWARSIRDQCTAAGVPFFFKQWGEWAPYSLNPVSHEDGALTQMTCVSSTDRKEVGRISYLAGCGHGKPSIPLRKAGKARSGRMLDGREWNEMPTGAAP
jgi:protein gp37